MKFRVASLPHDVLIFLLAVCFIPSAVELLLLNMLCLLPKDSLGYLSTMATVFLVFTTIFIINVTVWRILFLGRVPVDKPESSSDEDSDGLDILRDNIKRSLN